VSRSTLQRQMTRVNMHLLLLLLLLPMVLSLTLFCLSVPAVQCVGMVDRQLAALLPMTRSPKTTSRPAICSGWWRCSCTAACRALPPCQGWGS